MHKFYINSLSEDKLYINLFISTCLSTKSPLIQKIFTIITQNMGSCLSNTPTTPDFQLKQDQINTKEIQSLLKVPELPLYKKQGIAKNA